jgi:solute carrier family 32 (vesicular inhibitory amino acid transporter)
MAIVGAASPDPPNGSSPAALPGLEQPLHAHHGTLQPRKETAAGDHEAQLTPEPDGATFVRTCFNGLNGLSGE